YAKVLQKMLRNDSHSVSATIAIMTRMRQSEEPELFDSAKPLLSKHASALDTACLREEVPLENEIFILKNVDEDAAVIIGGGISYAYSKKDMPQALRHVWETSIVKHSTKNYGVINELKH